MQAAIGECSGADNKKIHLQRKGLWDSWQTMKMRRSDGGGRTRIGNHFELEQDNAEDSISAAAVDVVTLDEAPDERHISFLKLEIEGEELQALHGGRNIIRGSRPKIALSNYHRARDLIELFDEVESLDAGYNFVHHRESLSGGVYYCVPSS